MRFDVLTLFPEAFPGTLGLSLTGRALAEGQTAAVRAEVMIEGILGRGPEFTTVQGEGGKTW